MASASRSHPSDPEGAPRAGDAGEQAVPAPDHVVAHLFDSELERLAFGRGDTPIGQARAAAAVREIARRQTDIAARSGEAAAMSPEVADRDRAPGSTGRPRVDPPTGARWGRAVAVATAGILTLVIVATSVPTSPAADEASSLDVFAREATADELALEPQLEREGLRLSVVPRIIAERDGARLVAYRVIVTSPTERPRNEVCLIAVAERALGAPSCVDRQSLEQSGMQVSLAGRSGRYVVQWGPTGAPSVSVVAADAARIAPPRSIAAESFFTDAQRDSDLTYAALLRELYPDDRLLVRVLSSTPDWDAVGALIASPGTGLWSYCVHLFARGASPQEQLGARVTCAGREPFERDGLIAQARTAGSTLVLEWRPDDTVRVDSARIDPAQGE